MESYSRVSKLLWRLRRSERALCMAWRTLKVGSPVGSGITSELWCCQHMSDACKKGFRRVF
jgi:hypothetical protein